MLPALMSQAGKEAPAGFFEATIWSTILKAKGDDQAEGCQAAMERLLSRYRLPILRHIQASLPSHRRSPEYAEDLTQEFIHQLLRTDFLRRVDPREGRFRTFIKVCIKNFLRDQYVRETAAKRGGGRFPDSLDETDAEGNRLLDPAHSQESPDRILDREWARSIVDAALKQLEQKCVTSKQGELFDALKAHLGRAPDSSSAKAIGERLGMKEAAVHTAMNRLRGSLGKLIRQEVLQTVSTEPDCREEIRYLVDLMGK